MSWWRRLRMRIQRALYLPAGADREIDDEIRFHLAEETRLQAERGLPAAEAATAARRAFGSVALAKENTRAVWVSTTFEQLVQDLRIGCRILTKAPAVSATAVILIALVIGGNTTVFSIAHGIISKAGSRRSCDRPHDPQLGGGKRRHRNARRASRVRAFPGTEHGAADRGGRLSARHPDARERQLRGSHRHRVAELLRHARRSPRQRQKLHPGRSGARHVRPRRRHRPSRLAERLRRDRTTSSGRSVAVNGQPATVVGVADPEFRGAWLAEIADLWVPLAGEFRQWLQPNRSGVAVAMFGRRAPGVSLSTRASRARHDLDAAAAGAS